METIGDITVERPVPQSVVIYIKQDDDVIVVYIDEIGDLADAIRDYLPSPVEEPTPAPENATNVEEMRMKRIVARVRIQQLRRDVAYEEGKIAVIDTILEEG